MDNDEDDFFHYDSAEPIDQLMRFSALIAFGVMVYGLCEIAAWWMA